MRNYHDYQKNMRRLAAVIAFALAGTGCFIPVGHAAAVPELAQSTVTVYRYSFSGQDLVPGSELAALLKDSLGKPLALGELEKQADIITRYLRAQGYMVAIAYIPPQDFAKGNVDIAIEIGRYDAIIIDNTSKANESAIRRELGSVQPGAVIRKDALERAALLIGDLANTEAKTSLAAGSKPGTTTLTIQVKPKGKPDWGYVGLDNGGYRHTGRYEYSALYNHGNPFREGDLFTASVLYTGQGQDGGSVSYTSPFMNQGSRWGVSYARSSYSLGGPFSQMGANGTADTLSISYQKNLKRTRDNNLYGTVRFDSKKLRDEMELMGSDARKHSYNWVFGLNGDSMDAWQGGGSNTYSLTYTYGNLAFDDLLSEILDWPMLGGLGTAGHFGKWNFNATRLQQIQDRLTLYMTYSYQWANKNLDSSEKMSLGGPYGVRAYPIGEASGDQGWIGSAELRYNLPAKADAKQTWQLISFIDGGSVQLNTDNPWWGGGNRRTLSGAGVGVNWSQENNWAARLHYAWKLGSEPAQSDTDRNGRIWFQLYRFY